MKRKTILLIITVALLFTGCNVQNQNKGDIKKTEEASSSQEVNETIEKTQEERKTGIILNKISYDEVIQKTKEWEITGFEHLLYASYDKVVISGNIGLLVYDFNEKKITRALDVQVLGMNHDQGDTMTNFKFNKDGSKILMYNSDPDSKDGIKMDKIYLYDVLENELSKVDYTSLENEYTYDWKNKKYKEINTYDNEYTNKYSEFNMFEYRYIDDDNICMLLMSKSLDGQRGMPGFNILMVNKETKEEKMYKVDL